MKPQNIFSLSKYKLRTQLILSLGIILFLTIGGVSIYSIGDTKKQEIDAYSQELESMRSTALGIVEGVLENELNLVGSWASQQGIRAIATFASTLDPVNDLWMRYEGTKWGDSNDPFSANVTEKTELTIDYTNDVNPDISIWLNDLLEDFPYAELFFTDARGYAISSTGNTGDFAQADEEWWQNAATDNQFISDFEYDESSSSWSISISAVIQTINSTQTNGNVAGVFKAQYTFGSLIDELEEALINEHNNHLLVIYSQVDSQIVYRSDSEAASASFTDVFLSGKENKKLGSDEEYFGLTELKSDSYYVSKGHFVLSDEWPLQWNILIALPESVLTEVINEQISTTLLLSTFILIVVGFGSYFVSKYIVGQIEAIQLRANEVANGDLSGTVEVKTNAKDEISKLANNFNAMTQSLRTLVDEISDLSRHTASTAEELASSSEEVTASVEEVSSTTHSMAKGASQQAEMISQMVVSINQAGEMIENIIDRIQQNTTLVGEIAQETKYLALNARIEAARAGASGRGFSVVAEDVKNLSEQSRETAEAVTEIVESISTTLKSFFNEMKERVETIAAVSEETAASAEEVAAATEEMSATMEEISASSQELTHQSAKAEERISQFKLK